MAVGTQALDIMETGLMPIIHLGDRSLVVVDLDTSLPVLVTENLDWVEPAALAVEAPMFPEKRCLLRLRKTAPAFTAQMFHQPGAAF